MAFQTVSPLKIGLKVEHNESPYKIVNHEKPDNYARTYIIQSLENGQIRRVFRHEIFPWPANVNNEPVDDFSGSDTDLIGIDATDYQETPADMTTTTNKPRFKPIPSEVQLNTLAMARNEPTTDKQTAWGVKLLRGWLSEIGKNTDFESLQPYQLNEILRSFYASLQTKKGTDYSKSALVGIRAAISRHLSSPPYNCQISLMKDREFMTSNHVITGMVKTLKREGKDTVVHKKAVADGDIEKLYSSGVFSTDNPVNLQYKVFWDILLNFGRRGQEGLHQLKKDSYAKFTDDKGENYYKITYNETDKTHHGCDSKETDNEIRMYAKPGDDNCPVASLDLYLSKLHPDCNALFQQPLQYPKQTCWYAKQPLGKNKLSDLMPRISAAAKLSKRYTNHSIRATVATNLKRAGVDLLSIMSITGHRNVKSLESYIADPTDQQKRELSAKLQVAASGQPSRPSPVIPATTDGINMMALSSVSTTNTMTVQRNPVTDTALSLFQNATISGGTFNIRVLQRDDL